jgi:elongation factor Tu
MTSDPFFRMTIADVFFIKGRGTVVIGTVESGTLKVGDQLNLAGSSGSSRAVTVTGIEQLRKLLTEAQAGDNVGVLLRGVEKKDVQAGDVLLGA